MTSRTAVAAVLVFLLLLAAGGCPTQTPASSLPSSSSAAMTALPRSDAGAASPAAPSPVGDAGPASQPANGAAVPTTPVAIPAHLADGSVGCFGWSPSRQLYACARVVNWPGDTCVAVDLVTRAGARSVPVAGGKRCGGEGPRRQPAEIVAEEGVVVPLQGGDLVRDVPVVVGGTTVVLQMGGSWQLARRCPDGQELVVSPRLPGSFVDHYAVAWAPGAPFVAVVGFSHTAMEPGAPVEAVRAAAVDLGPPCPPGP